METREEELGPLEMPGKICNVTFISIYVILFVWHTFTGFKTLQKKGSLQFKKMVKKHPSFCLTIFLLINGLAIEMFFSFEIWGLFSDCRFLSYYESTSYQLFKYMLYFVLIVRSHECFRDTVIEFKPKLLKLLLIILTIWVIINVIIMNITNDPQWNGSVCIQEIPQSGWIVMIILDVIALIGNAYLFCTPLIKLSKLFKHDRNTTDLTDLAKKQFILSFSAVLSTIITFICMALWGEEGEGIFVGADVLISTYCILAMYQWNKFCWCNCQCLLYPTKWIKSRNDVSNLEGNIKRVASDPDIEITVDEQPNTKT